MGQFKRVELPCQIEGWVVVILVNEPLGGVNYIVFIRPCVGAQQLKYWI